MIENYCKFPREVYLLEVSLSQKILSIYNKYIAKSMVPEYPQPTKQHCIYCFQVLEAKLKNQPLPPYPKQLQDASVPIFVTWMIGDQLRGCIGTFSPDKLSKILGEYALISSLEDDRFDPVDLTELPTLNVGLSFLVNFVPNLGAYDWQIGKNGIILELRRNGRKFSATFLPEVAQEQKWDKKTTLKHLLRKSGCNLPLDMVVEDIKITTYESSKMKLEYKDIAPKE